MRTGSSSSRNEGHIIIAPSKAHERGAYREINDRHNRTEGIHCAKAEKGDGPKARMKAGEDESTNDNNSDSDSASRQL